MSRVSPSLSSMYPFTILPLASIVITPRLPSTLIFCSVEPTPNSANSRVAASPSPSLASRIARSQLPSFLPSLGGCSALLTSRTALASPSAERAIVAFASAIFLGACARAVIFSNAI